jgi:outer membrane protein assembly factor BamB
MWSTFALAQPPMGRTPTTGTPPAPKSGGRPGKSTGRLALFPVQPAWSTPIGAGLSASPGFSGARAFLALEDEEIVAFDLTTGTEVWRVSGQTKAAPVVVDSLVYLVAPDAIVALRVEDGSETWRSPWDAPLSTAVMSNGGWLILAGQSGSVTALRTTDGTQVWQREIGTAANAPPTIAGDQLYLPTQDGRVVALALETGAPLWERRLNGAAHAILERRDRLYLGSDDNFFYCIDARDGVVRWRWRTGADIVGTPVADSDRVYFAALDNVLRALDLGSGAQRWKRALAVRPNIGPVLAADTLIISGLSPAIQGFFLKDGTPAGDVQTGGLLAGPPHVVDSDAVPMPLIVYVSRLLDKGVTLSAVTRNVEPAITPVAPLPNAIPVPPTLVLPGSATGAPSTDGRNH